MNEYDICGYFPTTRKQWIFIGNIRQFLPDSQNNLDSVKSKKRNVITSLSAKYLPSLIILSISILMYKAQSILKYLSQDEQVFQHSYIGECIMTSSSPIDHL